MSSNGFVELKDAESLEKFIQDSHARPSILFKHSNTCGVSARAYREMAKVEKTIGIVTVQDARSLSNQIENRFALPHETPQVLILRHGNLAWSASHFRITAEAVNRAVDEAAG